MKLKVISTMLLLCSTSIMSTTASYAGEAPKWCRGDSHVTSPSEIAPGLQPITSASRNYFHRVIRAYVKYVGEKVESNRCLKSASAPSSSTFDCSYLEQYANLGHFWEYMIDKSQVDVIHQSFEKGFPANAFSEALLEAINIPGNPPYDAQTGGARFATWAAVERAFDNSIVNHLNCR
jgi:hypothetical protein